MQATWLAEEKDKDSFVYIGQKSEKQSAGIIRNLFRMGWLGDENKNMSQNNQN